MDDEPWTYGQIRRLIYGSSRPDAETGDGYADRGLSSAYMQRCTALDKGKPELMLDAIQLDMTIDKIKNPAIRAAVTLAANGWDAFEIDEVLKSSVPATGLIHRGIQIIEDDEYRRGI